VPGSLVGVLTVPARSQPLPRHSLLTSAIWLSALTIGWNVVAGGLAIGVSLAAGSLSLGGFGLNALIDTGASVVLVWRFWKDRDDPRAAATLERRAEVAIGAAMLGVAIFLSAEASHALATASHPETSPGGLAITIASLALLPWLSHAKLRVARSLPSRALRADAILTGASATLAGLTLVALSADALFNWWWADAAAALVIAATLVAEVTRATTAIHFGRAAD
jgi:divalent metal cation (Fe/Co/Zn/Cd) transporter